MSDFFYKKVDAYHIAKEYVIHVYSLLRNYPYISSSELKEAETKAEHLAKVMSGLKNYLTTKININS